MMMATRSCHLANDGLQGEFQLFLCQEMTEGGTGLQAVLTPQSPCPKLRSPKGSEHCSFPEHI